MRTASILSLATLFTAAFAVSAMAAKPYVDNGDGTYTWNGNNYPSGSHFNLNIHGKKDGFVCGGPEYEFTIIDAEDPLPLDDIVPGDIVVAESCPTSYTCVQGDQVYGNVINVPRTGSDIGILMESGRKGPKGKPGATELEVTDWCTADFDGDDASLRLPKDPDGYMVFARVTGKPGDGTGASVTINGCLNGATDEDYQDLVLLGLLTTDGGSFVPNCSDGTSENIELMRIGSGGGKRVNKATNITQLFEWSGEVCYLQEDVSDYCGGTNPECSEQGLCCVDTDADTLYDRCDSLDQVGIDPDGDGVYECPAADTSGFLYTELTAQCQQYVDHWVFNIADYVEYLWGLDNDGSYNIKVRFYPLSEQSWWPLPTSQ